MMSDRAGAIVLSSTFVINKKVQDLKKEGFGVVNFGLGESHFGIPKTIRQDALNSTKNGDRRYTPVKGIPELRESICSYLNKFNLNYKKDEIIVDAGSKHLIFSIMLALANPGDEIILQTPYWVSYRDQSKLAQLKINLVGTKEEDNFKIDPGVLNEAITKKTKLLIINTPNNPSGIVYNKKEIKGIAEVAVDNNIFVISDEIYSEFTFYNKHVSIASLGEEIKRKTITTGGFSKSYSVGGWRLGFAAGEKEVIDALQKIVSNTTSCAPIISQKACINVFQNEGEYLKKCVREYKRNAEHLHKRLIKIKGVRCAKPEGAFYIFPNISSFFGKKVNGKTINNSEDFCSLLLEEEKVATLPGTDFGFESNLRISLGIPFKEVKEGGRRIESFIQKIE